jgi:hypothetical protein
MEGAMKMSDADIAAVAKLKIAVLLIGTAMGIAGAAMIWGTGGVLLFVGTLLVVVAGPVGGDADHGRDCDGELIEKDRPAIRPPLIADRSPMPIPSGPMGFNASRARFSEGFPYRPARRHVMLQNVLD